MWKKVLNYIIGILFILSLITIGILGYQNYGYRTTPPEKIEIHDTFTIHKDSIHEKILYKTKFDTILDVHYKDTIIYDTIYLDIEHNQSNFSIKKDSLTINETIWHSGFHSTIDSVKLDYNWNYEITKPKPKKFGWCITIGPSINYGITLDTQNITWTHGPSAGFSIVIGPSYIIK